MMMGIKSYKAAAFAIAIMSAAAVAVLHPAGAEETLTIGDILGRWCGQTTDYDFSQSSLTVIFHSGNIKRVRSIDKYNIKDNDIELIWKGGGNTIFEKFSPDRQNMVQAQNAIGDKGPRREFHRC